MIVPKVCTTLSECADRSDDELSKISNEISWYEDQARKSVAMALRHKVEVGRRLIRAKKLLPRGKFLAWAQQEFGWTPRHVQNHMALAANIGQISHLAPGASLRMALAAIRGGQALAVKVAEDDIEPVNACELRSVQRICFIGEVQEGSLDCEQLMAELARLQCNLGAGAPKIKWKTTVSKAN